MSQTPDNPNRDGKVSMDKPAAEKRPRGGFGAAALGGSSRRPTAKVPAVPVPRMINIAHGFLGLMIVGLWLRAIGFAGNDAMLQKFYTDANNKAKKPDKNFNAVDAVHQIRVGNVVAAVVITIAAIILVGAMRRTRTAGATRWGLLIILVLTQLPFYIVPQSGLPFLASFGGVLAGIGSIAGIVLLFVPQSAAYFRECKIATLPPGVEPRPSLFGSMLKPRAGGGQPPTRRGAAARPAATRPDRTAPARNTGSARSTSSSSKAKAKVRGDADAIAKGAELARSRAKSNKTRR